MFQFKDPWVFMLIGVIALVFLLKAIRQNKTLAYFLFSSGQFLEGVKPTLKQRAALIPTILRVLAIVLMLVSLGRPQTILEGSRTISEGVDIVLAIDTSTSMLGEDFKIGNRRINRFEVVREVVKEFIDKRPDDRIAMVAFAARAYTVCPLATDHKWLSENLDRVRVGMIEDATAIGSAIMSSLARLKGSKTKSKIIILLTDGVSNAGNISPLVGAEAAKAMKIKVYTIGVGTKGLVPYPVKDMYGRSVYTKIPIDIDEVSLKKISEMTGGKYYRATDTESLRKIYDDINRLEKSNIEHQGWREYNEQFGDFLIPALLILLLEILLSQTVFLRVP